MHKVQLHWIAGNVDVNDISSYHIMCMRSNSLGMGSWQFYLHTDLICSLSEKRIQITCIFSFFSKECMKYTDVDPQCVQHQFHCSCPSESEADDWIYKSDNEMVLELNFRFQNICYSNLVILKEDL